MKHSIVLERCNPKNVTHSKNFPGRTHTAIHLRNYRFGNSTLLRTKALGAALTPGSSVIKHLKQEQYLEVYQSKRKLLRVKTNTVYDSGKKV